jgi:hypothetical protein
MHASSAQSTHSSRDGATTGVHPIRNNSRSVVASDAKKEVTSAEFAAGMEGLVQYDPSILNNILRDLEMQVNSKCNQIQKDAEFMCTSVKQAFHLELIKLPSQVKGMSLSRFRSEFGDSIEAVTRGTMSGKAISATGASTGSRENHKNLSGSGKSSRMSSSGGVHKPPSTVFSTPSGRKNKILQTPGTASRRPREGEALMSANGSPLGEFDSTAVKAPKPQGIHIPATPGVHVPLSSGEVVDIEEADIDSMTTDVRLDALAKMQAMMANMQTLMNKLQSKK